MLCVVCVPGVRKTAAQAWRTRSLTRGSLLGLVQAASHEQLHDIQVACRSPSAPSNEIICCSLWDILTTERYYATLEPTLPQIYPVNFTG